MNDEPADRDPGGPRERTPEEIAAEGAEVSRKAHAALEALGALPEAQPGEPQSDAFAIAEAETQKKSKRRRRPRQKALLVDLAASCTFWRTPSGQAIITMPIGTHFENHAVRSNFVRVWLSCRAFEDLNIAPSAQAIDDSLRIFEARAWSEGKVRDAWLRCGFKDGAIYIDRCDADWTALKITPGGVEKVSSESFVRMGRARELPAPEEGYSIDEFRRFANVETEDDFVLLVGWLVGALRGRGPYAGLFVHGENGSGKTLLLRFISDLVDPCSPATQGPPREERDLIASAQNRYLLALDNLSHIDAVLSDAICRLLSGAGFAARALHTDRDESAFAGARPIAVNGITALADRADLNDRAVIVRLKSIPDNARLAEDDLEAEWKIARPRILGALFTAASAALRNVDTIKLTRLTRMADFEKWVAAAEGGLGWEPGTFADAYRRNRKDSSDTVFEADLVAVAIRDFVEIEKLEYWDGTATELLARLNTIVPESTKSVRSWPKTNYAFGNQLARSIQLLRARGISVEKRHSGDRKIIIARVSGGTS